MVTTTDERGQFSFAELADGTWTLEVEMLGFAKLTREVGVAHDAPPPELSLKILSEAALLPVWNLRSRAATASPRDCAAPAPRSSPAVRVQRLHQQAAFQRVNVNQSAATSAITNEGAIKTEEIADLNQSAANSFIVQGSLSTAAGLPQQNDWGFGGRGMGPDGMGGPGNGRPWWRRRGRDSRDGGRRPRAGGPGGGMGVGGGRGGLGGGPGGGGLVADPAVRAVPRWAADPEWAAAAVDAAVRTGKGVRTPWPSATAGATRALPYNGNASFTLDNSVWDARTYSVTGAASTNRPTPTAAAAVMFGGPLQIPKLVSASKRIMFTFDYQLQRNRTGTISEPGQHADRAGAHRRFLAEHGARRR